MDYELMVNGNIKIGQPAPDFNATTTMGNISLNKYKGKWVVLFSHPGDFTPVWAYNLGKYQKCLILLNISLIDNLLVLVIKIIEVNAIFYLINILQ